VVVLAVVTPGAYGAFVGAAALTTAALCWLARTRPGPWMVAAARVIGLVLLADAVSYLAGLAIAGRFSPATSLPLSLCDAALLVAAAACLLAVPFLVELTWFWGMAGTLQGVATPDLAVGFPHLVFFEYLVGHLGIVAAALFLVIGRRLEPRPGAVRRVLLISGCYTAFVGVVDALSGADYMFLAKEPSNWTILRLLGPWPWYTATVTMFAALLFLLLDLPFHRGRSAPPPAPTLVEAAPAPARTLVEAPPLAPAVVASAGISAARIASAGIASAERAQRAVQPPSTTIV
jgi:hypothetical integral membrane protein (TIGR02206 family)